MKLAIKFVKDVKENTQAVQLPLSEWERVLAKLKKHEQTLKLKSHLTEAFEQVATLKKQIKKTHDAK